MADYPEHEKLRAISEKSQAIGEFIEWLAEDQGIQLCRLSGSRVDRYAPNQQPITKLLALFFEIDLDVIETEKRKMLDELRASNGQSKG